MSLWRVARGCLQNPCHNSAAVIDNLPRVTREKNVKLTSIIKKLLSQARVGSA